MAAHIVKPELLAQEIGQRASVNELAAVIQQPGDIRNGRRLRQRPLDLVLRVHAASMRFARSIVQLYLRVKGRASFGVATNYKRREPACACATQEHDALMRSAPLHRLPGLEPGCSTVLLPKRQPMHPPF